MELVVVNGANNIAKSVIRNLTSSGKFNRVRMLDFSPYKTGSYNFQRELAANGIQLDKRMTSNLGSLEVNMDGADQVVFLTHDYFSMTSCKNNTLVATAKLAKKLGVNNVVAVCPVEHDMAYSDDAQSWIEKRQEAEQNALAANSKMSILNTDLVYGSDATHLVHYMHQVVMAGGKIKAPFLYDDAKFKPVHHGDVANAVAKAMDTGRSGQFALRGSTEVSIRELLNMVEESCGVEAGKTKSLFEIPVLPLTRMLEEVLVGMAADSNMGEMLTHFAENPSDAPVTGDCFFQATGMSQEAELRSFFKSHRVTDSEQDLERLSLPTFGGYKFNYAD